MAVALGLGLSDIFSVKSFSYIINDQFHDTVAAGSLDSTAATPGPGTRAVVDTNSLFAASGGVFAVSGTPKSADYISYALLSRAAGRPALIRFIDRTSTTLGRIRFGLDNVVASNLSDYCVALWNATSFRILKRGTSLFDITGLSASPNPIDYALVMRAEGCFLFFNDNSSGWRLAYIYHDGSDDLYYKVTHLNSGVDYTADAFRVPDALWLPSPVMSDGFADDNGTALADHTSDGLGHAEGVAGGLGSGGDGFVWTEQNGDWEIQSNKVDPVGASPGGAGWVATFPAAEADLFAMVEVTTGVAGNSAGFILRYTDDDNFWLCAIHNTADQLYIFERSAGSWTTRSNIAHVLSDSTAYTLKILAFDQNIFFSVDDTTPVSYLSASFNENETICGFRSGQGGELFDDLVVFPFGAGAEFAALSNF